MTTLDPILYANGALRLTRHGKGRGETVLMHVPSGRQFSVPDSETRDLADEITRKFDFDKTDTLVAYCLLAEWFRDPVAHDKSFGPL